MTDTRIVKNPSCRNVTRTVPLAELDAWLEQGWLPLLDAEQEARYRELEAEAADETPPFDEGGYLAGGLTEMKAPKPGPRNKQ